VARPQHSQTRTAVRTLRHLAPIAMLWLAACCSKEPKDRSPSTGPATAPSLARTPEGSRVPQGEPGSGAEDGSVTEQMKDHYSVATQVRDALLRGDLAATQGPLTWLGQHGFWRRAPASFRPHLDRMQAAARRAKDRVDLTATAGEVARVALACGQCHAALGRGPTFQPSGLTDLEEPAAPAQVGVALQRRMHAHFWAADRMWEGLIGPWDTAWREGALALAELQLPKGVPEAARSELARLHALAGEATAAEDGESRARVYGRVIAQCGGCHATSATVPF
jgi:mono/diheme cytochrome c family protein